MITIPSSTEAGRLTAPLGLLRSLDDAVEALAAGVHPKPSRLAAAPLLTDWRLSRFPVPCLVGDFGHQPSSTHGRKGWTDDLTAYAYAFVYARPSSKLNYLGASGVKARP